MRTTQYRYAQLKNTIMNTKADQIAEIIKILQKDNQIRYCIDQDGGVLNETYGFHDKYDKVEFWEDISPHFSDLDNINYVILENGEFYGKEGGDIFSKLASLKNLRYLTFTWYYLDTAEKYIENLRLLPQLETLLIVDTRLIEFPKSIFSLNKLYGLSVIGNKFYKQNFYFKLKGGNDYERIYQKIKEKNNYGFDMLWETQYEEYAWGLFDAENEALILEDKYHSEWNGTEKNISVFVLKDNKKDKYDNFNIYYQLFTKINKELDCFETYDNGDLKMFFFFENEYTLDNAVYFEELKNEYFAGNVEYTKINTHYNGKWQKHQVIKLLQYLGGNNLVKELSEEKRKINTTSTLTFENNLYIESVELQNFKQFESTYKVNLSLVNILIGKNSTGKTSFLQAVALCFAPEHTDQIPLSKSFINRKLITTQIKDLHIAQITVKWKQREVNKKNNFATREQYIYPKKLSANQNMPQTYLVLAYGENLFPDSSKAFSISTRFVEYLHKGEHSNFSVEPLFSDYYSELINPIYILDRLQPNQLPKGLTEGNITELTEIKNILLNTLNNYFLNVDEADLFNIQIINKQYRFVDKKGNDFDLYDLSEGYRTNISLVTDILVKIFAARNVLFLNPYEHTDFIKILANVKGTILIDEFDKHLHPVWQKSFVGKLREVLPNIQFILSTHNVVALQSAEGQTALKMYATETGNIKIEEKIIKKGDSIETLLNKFFDFESQFMGKATQADYDDFKKVATKIMDNEEDITNDFIVKVKKLLGDNEEPDKISEELTSRIKTQLAQIEYITGKTIEL